MKTIRIDGRLARVFVLQENENSLVYIPVKSLFRVDYNELKKLEDQGGELMKTLARHTLPNGRNALVQYDHLIQVLRFKGEKKDQGVRVKKPEEKMDQFQHEENKRAAAEKNGENLNETKQESNSQDNTQQDQENSNLVKDPDTGEVRPRRKPGPKPKNQ